MQIRAIITSGIVQTTVALAFALGLVTPPDLHAIEASFPVYDGIKSQNKPDLSKFGLLPIRVLYTASLWTAGQSREEPDLTRIRSVAGTLAPSIPVCVDIEHWPTTGTPEKVNSSISKLGKVATVIRAQQPNIRLGFYSMLPVRDYWRAIGAKGVKRKDQWMRENIALKPLAGTVDIIFPSLYTLYNDPAGWERHAIENIKEAKKFGKPVYVFLWPKYTDGSAFAGQPLPVEFWRLQLDVSRRLADGIVIWDKSTSTWDETASWWHETLRFLRK